MKDCFCAAAASTTAEMIKEQSLKKVEGVFDSATKGFNNSLNFILSGEGVNFSSPNMTNVPPNSPNVSKCHSPNSTTSDPPRTPAPAGVYSYPSSTPSNYSSSGGSSGANNLTASNMAYASGGSGGGKSMGGIGAQNSSHHNNTSYFTYPNNAASHQQKELTSVSHIGQFHGLFLCCYLF